MSAPEPDDRPHDPRAPVLVTGATGYVAARLVERLLEDGRTVHATVRDPGDLAKRAVLDELAEARPGTIRYFAADLLDEDAFDEPMRGCEVVFHTASPFRRDVDDVRRELIEPALNGTRHVLSAAIRTPSVRRVVQTSSVAAVYGDNADLRDAAGAAFTEDDWNTTSSPDHQAYSYSKTVAEREAWRLVSESESGCDLVTVLPSFVLGPAVDPRRDSESLKVVRQLADGTMQSGVPHFEIGVVDVRDVAEAHVAAAFRTRASGRYIVSGRDASLPEIARVLRERFGGRGFAFPRRVLPKWLVWLVGPLVDRTLTRKAIARNVGHRCRLDNGRSVRELGMRYRPFEQTVTEMFEQLVAEGVDEPRD